ncbi:hypothetical protein ACTGJ9_033665 [Bradyrhizobium sp. RDM12]
MKIERVRKPLFDQAIAGLHAFASGERHDQAGEVFGTLRTTVSGGALSGTVGYRHCSARKV